MTLNKEIIWFFEIFRIPLKAASNFILQWTPYQTISRSFFQKFQVLLLSIYLPLTKKVLHSFRQSSLPLRGFHLHLKQ